MNITIIFSDRIDFKIINDWTFGRVWPMITCNGHHCAYCDSTFWLLQYLITTTHSLSTFSKESEKKFGRRRSECKSSFVGCLLEPSLFGCQGQHSFRNFVTMKEVCYLIWKSKPIIYYWFNFRVRRNIQTMGDRRNVTDRGNIFDFSCYPFSVNSF